MIEDGDYILGEQGIVKKNFLPMEHLGESQCAKNTQISFTVQAMKIMLRFFPFQFWSQLH